MAYAEGGIVPQPQVAPDRGPSQQEEEKDGWEKDREPDEGEGAAPEKPHRFGWTLPDEELDRSPNPYVDHAAVH